VLFHVGDSITETANALASYHKLSKAFGSVLILLTFFIRKQVRPVLKDKLADFFLPAKVFLIRVGFHEIVENQMHQDYPAES